MDLMPEPTYNEDIALSIHLCEQHAKYELRFRYRTAITTLKLSYNIKTHAIVKCNEK